VVKNLKNKKHVKFIGFELLVLRVEKGGQVKFLRTLSKSDKNLDLWVTFDPLANELGHFKN